MWQAVDTPDKLGGTAGAYLSDATKRGRHRYDAAAIADACRVIPLAIAARASRVPEERPFEYQPLPPRVWEGYSAPGVAEVLTVPPAEARLAL